MFVYFRCPCGTHLRASGKSKAASCPDCFQVVPLPRWDGSVVILCEEPPCPPPAPPPPTRWTGLTPLCVAALVLVGGCIEAAFLDGFPALPVIALAIAFAASYYIATGAAAARYALVGALSIGLIGTFVALAMTGGHFFGWLAMIMHIASIFPFLTPGAADYDPGHSMPRAVTWAIGAPAAAVGLAAVLAGALL